MSAWNYDIMIPAVLNAGVWSSDVGEIERSHPESGQTVGPGEKAACVVVEEVSV